MEVALQAIWARQRPEILSRLDSMEEVVAALLAGDVPDELRRRAVRDAHKVAGSAGTFGFWRSSELARDIEAALASPAALEMEAAAWLSEHLETMRRQLEGARSEGGAHVQPPAEVLVVSAQTEITARLAAAAADAALAVRRVAADVLGTADIDRAAAVVLDAPAGIVDSTLRLVADVAGRARGVPVVVLADGASLEHRVAVLRAGGRAVVSQTADARRLIDAVVGAIDDARAERPRVLALDDDAAVLDTLGTLLDGAGIDVTAVADADTFWADLRQSRPDLVILDVDVPGVDGVELCRVLRSEPGLADIPVLFLTGRTDAETLQRAFAAGADDYVAKPIVEPVLVTRLRNRLERVRLSRELLERDQLTGVTTRAASQQTIERLLADAAAADDALSLAFLDVDALKRVNDRFGHDAGDAVLRGIGGVLRTTFRSGDVVARWGGEEFVVALWGVGADGAAARIATVFDRLRAEGIPGAGDAGRRVTVSAGVAERVSGGDDLRALYAATDDALRRAKAGGGDRVVIARERQGARVERVDVAVVEDDEALAEVLLHALSAADLTARWIPDGLEARRALTGDEPSLSARLLVLDVDLPGLDGLSLLRALDRDGVMRRTRAVMLTARAAEEDTLAALRLGAVDHVAKPFSVPILMHRIGLALQP